jgi:hypothetical protein
VIQVSQNYFDQAAFYMALATFHLVLGTQEKRK